MTSLTTMGYWSLKDKVFLYWFYLPYFPLEILFFKRENRYISLISLFLILGPDLLPLEEVWISHVLLSKH